MMAAQPTEQITVVGLGLTGLSVVRHLRAHGGDGVALRVVDTRGEPPNAEQLTRRFPDVTCLFGTRDKVVDYAGVDRVVVSPGVPLDAPVLQDANARGIPLVSDIDLFFEAVSAPVVGITGTNGKSTVTALTAHLLGGAFERAVAGGNLGVPALELLDERADVYVLELSSFQLERMAPQPLAAATILNLTEDHLDRHGAFDVYRAAKQRIYRGAGFAVFNRDDPLTAPPATLPATSFGLDAPLRDEDQDAWGLREWQGEPAIFCGDEFVVSVAAIPLAGRHGLANAMAALALGTALGVPVASLVERLEAFTGLPHRCTVVAEANGVRYVNDSKATNVGACVAALRGLGDGQNLVLIAGGDTKGADFAPLRPAVADHVRHLVLLGVDTDALAQALGDVVPCERASAMGDAVAAAMARAQPGDTVLLSPACASFDLFRNFEDRGERFEQSVRELLS